MNDLADANKLYDAFLASLKCSAWKEEPQRFEADFLSEIAALQRELNDGSYVVTKGYEFDLNERGKTRHIHGSRMRDRVVRHVLCDTELTPAFERFLIHNNGASQKGKGITFARNIIERDLHNFWLKYRTNDGYVAFVDFSKFYDNIQHDKVRNIVSRHVGEDAYNLVDKVLKSFEVDVSFMSDEEFDRCLDIRHDSVEYYSTIPDELKTGEKMMKKAVDIGDQVSQNIGIFFPMYIDNYVKIVRGQKWYGRYMDDMYIICKDREELKSIIAGIHECARELGIFINEKKTRIVKLSGSYKYLQIKYTLSDRGKVIKRISPKNVTAQRRRIKAYKRLLDKGVMPYVDIENACKSWMGNFYRIMSKKQIHHIKELYWECFGKELRWKQR